MKSRNIWKWSLGMALLLMAGGCLQGSSTAPSVMQSTTTTAVVAEPGVEGVVGATAAENITDSDSVITNLAEAPASPVSTNPPVPPTIRPSGPVADVIKLANSGVEEGVMLAYVTNSPSTFNLAAEEIIYLNDIGVPAPVVTAMIERDQTLKDQAAASVAPEPPPPPVEEPIPQPAPVEVAAQPDYSEAPEPVPPPPSDVTYTTFYDSLAPYGAWIEVGGYGRCWRPTVVMLNPGWQPYFDGGHWVYTDYGWYWLSDYSWGWAPFHYGRWFRHYRYGWCWAPDTIWGPSWVSWRYTDNYCGWAPLPPGVCFSFGIGFTFYGRPIHDWGRCGLHRDHYRFVAWRHFDDHHLNHYAAGRRVVDGFYNRTVVANKFVMHKNTVIHQGIAPERVASATHRPVRRVTVRETTRHDTAGLNGRFEQLSAGGKTLTVYRPVMPKPVTTADRVAERTTTLPHRGPDVRPTANNRAGSAPSAPSAASASERLVTVPSRQPRTDFSATPGTHPTSRPSQPAPVVSPNPSRTTTARDSSPSSRVITIGRTGSTRTPQAPARTSSSFQVRPSTTARSGGINSPGSLSVPRQVPAPYGTFGGTANRPRSTSSRFNTGVGQSQPQTAAPAARAPQATPAPRFEAPRTAPLPSSSSRQFNSRTFRSQTITREVPRYTPTPSYSRPQVPRSAPSRSFTAPQRPQTTRSYSPPAQRVPPAPSAPAPSRAPAVQSRSAPPSPPTASRNGSRGSSGSSRGGGRNR